jgi:hypothetical protein
MTKPMTKPHIHLVAVTEADSFIDSMSFCKTGLIAHGYEVSTAAGVVMRDSLNILFCSQMLSWQQIARASHNVIVYNWEPGFPDIGRFPPGYILQMQKYHTWDYHAQNVERLRLAGVQDIHHVPVGYTPEMQRVPKGVIQDIDVLFYGYHTSRRQKVIDAIQAMGLNIVTSQMVGYMKNEERDAYIARSKVVLNMHTLDSAHVFELARVGYLLANHKAVVTEISDTTEIEDDMRDVVVGGPIDTLAQLCYDLVHDDARRHDLERRAFAAFSQRSASDVMKTAMDRYLLQARAHPIQLGNTPSYSAPIPRCLRLHVCDMWRFDHCNLDETDSFVPDLPIKIDASIDFDATLNSWRFGLCRLTKGMFTEIYAKNAFKRYKNFKQALSNCLSLLEDGGVLHVNAELALAAMAWSGIEARRAFHEHSWGKIIDNWLEYTVDSSRFEICQASYATYESFSNEWIHEHGWDAAFKQPRVVGEQSLTIRKRALNAQELVRLKAHNQLRLEPL